MNEHNLNVDFSKGRISTNLKKLVQNDYNTTKLNFTFDKDGRVLFKMLYPDGTQYVDEIQNNELVFGAGVLNQEGTYEYEISLYTEDGRLTDHAIGSFKVRSELVDTDELAAPDDRVPVLDNLINEVNTIKQDVEEGKYNGKDGSDGQDGVTPTIGENGNWFIDGVDTGMPSQGPEGPEGQPGKDGGVSLEEVTAITGNLEDLPTEYKDDLVGAISEVASNSGGSGITELVDAEIDLHTIDSGVYLISGKNTVIKYSAVSNDTNIIGDDITKQILIVSGSAGHYYSRAVRFNNSGSDLQITGYSYGAKFTYTWQDILTNSTALSKTNTTSYTPTKDYHPATKKYVDDAITNAITTVLEGEY